VAVRGRLGGRAGGGFPQGTAARARHRRRDEPGTFTRSV